jgi:hypothetical protein
LAASREINAAKPRGDHAGVVEYQDIAFVESCDDVAKLVVFDSVRFSVENEQAGFIAGWERLLCDEMFG